VRSLPLHTALEELIDQAASALRAELAAGAEVPFELEPRVRRRGAAQGPALYFYKALTGEFIASRASELERLPGYGALAAQLDSFEGLDRYLAMRGIDAPRAAGRVRAAVVALLQDVFDEQTDFELRPERVRAALDRLEQAAETGAGGVTLLAQMHGLTITSPELALTHGLRIAHPDALDGVPPLAAGAEHLLVVLTEAEDDDLEPHETVAQGVGVLGELLRALRLFGDGRVSLGALAWARVGSGHWSPLALGSEARPPRPQGMLVVTAEQEDELRAFCNLVSRRAPHRNSLAWALRRFELGCERASAYEALSDHFLGLRALLEPEGPESGLLAGRLAALCATPGKRNELTERIVEALALERAYVAGAAKERSSTRALAEEVAAHLRDLLRDVICGHLSPDLVALADEILLTPEVEDSGEQQLGHPGEADEILDILI
jgi:hypothetical protein